MHQLRTIGVYGFDASSFLDSLNKAGVSMLLDVRQRRGVRGTQYAWANSQRLQASLAASDDPARPAGSAVSWLDHLARSRRSAVLLIAARRSTAPPAGLVLGPASALPRDVTESLR